MLLYIAMGLIFFSDIWGSVEMQSEIRAYENEFNDPEWRNQWYMHDERIKLGPAMDLNVVPVYRMNITGEGVYVAVVGDEVNMDHPDLQKNLVKELSLSARDGKKKTAELNTAFEGTKTAGVIGMTANNSLCGVGIAFNAKLVAISREGDKSRPLSDAYAMIYAGDKVDIYSNSWGPEDTGSYMAKTEYGTARNITNGVKYGRGGRGAIYTFSSGSGHTNGDNCAADDLVNHVATIGITGASSEGKRSEHSECCAAIYATAFAGYGKSNKFVTTTGGDGECTSFYDGTPAAAAQASAVFALVLQANKNLTFRDVMHLVTMGSEVAPLADNDSWYKNGAGFWVSNEFGFGLINALNMVNMALTWTKVPRRFECEVKLTIEKHTTFQLDKPAIIKQVTDGCQSSTKPRTKVNYLEQVILTATIEHPYRGAISISLTSPAGTKTELLPPRKYDSNSKGLKEWNLKSVHNWGEDPKGEWQIEVKTGKTIDRTISKPETGRVVALTLWFYGTELKPDHHAKGKVPRTYTPFVTADGKTS